MELFDGDSEKVKELEKMIAEEMGFDAVVPVSCARTFISFLLTICRASRITITSVLSPT